MEILIFTRPAPARRVLRLGPWLAPAVVVASLSLGALAAGSIAYAAWLHQSRAAVAMTPAAAFAVRTAGGARGVTGAPVGSDVDLAGVPALARRIGELQAQVLRLDALGERLVDRLGLDPGEFDFSVKPAQGGPAPEARAWGRAELARDGRVLLAELESLSDRIGRQSNAIEALHAVAARRGHDAALRVAGAPVQIGWVSSPFGWRRDPVNGKRTFHAGIDFAAPPGTPIASVAAGVVTFAGRKNGYGNTVEVYHGGGTSTRYAHNQLNLVEVGDRVSQGEKIALVGSTGRSSGPHVHFEVRKDGKRVNPHSFVKREPSACPRDGREHQQVASGLLQRCAP